jgi:hypothetical protein
LPTVPPYRIAQLDQLTEEMYDYPCTWDWVYSDCYGSAIEFVRSYQILVNIVYGPGVYAPAPQVALFNCVKAAREWGLTLSEWRSWNNC